LSKKHIFKNFRGAIDDVFYNKFDKTWAKTEPGQKEFPRILTVLPTERAEDDGTVIYNFNSEFYRCDEFVSDHTNTHVLFAGCSQTEGWAAPLDTVWSKIVRDSLYPDSGFYSIAKGGYGWQKVISNFMVYVEKYGAPEYLFALLPAIGRFFVWHDETYVYIQRYPNGVELSKEEEEHIGKIPDGQLLEKPFTEDEHRRSFVDFALSWKLFEKYCESIGTKMLWASWDYEENVNYELANLSKNYISLSEKKMQDYVRKHRPDGKIQPQDFARRDGHAGILINQWWAEEFSNEITKRGWA
jgi:hypothetical protein